MSSPWRWDEHLGRYRNVDTGRFIGSKQMVELRDKFVRSMYQRTDDLARQVVSQAITPHVWRDEMRKAIKTSYIDQYVMARGGRGQMTPQDWGRLGADLRKQYAYLGRFEHEVAWGDLTPAQIAARSRMYINSSRNEFEQGHVAGMGLPRLPYYPGNDTKCLSNCRCSWSIKPVEGGWNVTWVYVHDKVACEDCKQRGQEWNNRFVPKSF